jgi:RNA polymerase sigma-70 factor (ECF subfamily)
MVVILRYQEDLDPVEIAGTLHMRLGTVRSHLRRSLGILRQKMARAGGGVGQ